MKTYKILLIQNRPQLKVSWQNSAVDLGSPYEINFTYWHSNLYRIVDLHSTSGASPRAKHSHNPNTS